MGGTRRHAANDRAGWNPWRALRELEHARLGHVELPEGVEGMLVPYSDHPVILLHENLTQVERNAALAHELVHLERGWPCRAPWAEEERVHDEVARRLVPLDQLHRWVLERERSDLNVENWEVADVWWVPEPVAERALRILYQRIRADIGLGKGR